nr:MAG TPA: hypothetical protein [Caudoviricetes sp.]
MFFRHNFKLIRRWRPALPGVFFFLIYWHFICVFEYDFVVL